MSSINQDLVVNLYLCENRFPICPKCGYELTISYDSDPGSWECEDCNLFYFVNITECKLCGNLVWNNDFDFDKMEAKYCNILDPETEMTCLDCAFGEEAQSRAEDLELDYHLKHCGNPDCLCRRVL